MADFLSNIRCCHLTKETHLITTVSLARTRRGPAWVVVWCSWVGKEIEVQKWWSWVPALGAPSAGIKRLVGGWQKDVCLIDGILRVQSVCVLFFKIFRLLLSWQHYYSLILTRRSCQIEIVELMDPDPKVIFDFLGNVSCGLVWAPCKRHDWVFNSARNPWIIIWWRGNCFRNF